MRIIDKILAAEASGEPYYSFEFFPPKTDSGSANLLARLERMSLLNPLFIDITWGAGGKTQSSSLLVSSGAQNFVGLETMMHLTCTNQTLEEVKANLEAAKAEGIQNILALRGDAPVGETEWKASDTRLRYGADLVRLIREVHGDFFGIGVAGYPYGHPECTSYEDDIKYLKEKVDAGADFVITQLFFDSSVFLKFVRDCRAAGITCPIIPGVLPIQGYQSLRHLSKMASTPIPQEISDAVEAVKHDDAAIAAYGVQQCVAMIRELQSAGVRGIHFYTLNRETSVEAVLKELSMKVSTPRALPWKQTCNIKRQDEAVRPIFWANRQKSYLIRTHQWDEFPNGRWGDSASPAFGELAEYHIFAMEKTREKAELHKAYGESPFSPEDVYATFTKFIKQEIQFLPWMDESLALETGTIKDNLIALNSFGFLTINSQPAINGVPSNDAVFGWGPSNGYVFQKAYIEFFTSPILLKRLLDVMTDFPSLCYHAVDVKGNALTNNKTGATTAVTWGVFPNMEILQPTIVDPVAFMHWKDEAFRLWLTKWACAYEAGSPASTLIHSIHDTFYLVNVVDNDFVRGDIFKIFERVMADGPPPANAVTPVFSAIETQESPRESLGIVSGVDEATMEAASSTARPPPILTRNLS